MSPRDAERRRLEEDRRREKNWKRWGPYLAERQWGTVREDYSADGEPWDHFPFEHAASRAYRWGEDGLLGLTDRECRLCFAPALWNGQDPILKERLFGLSGPQGNHGEDVKEAYFYLDALPTSAYTRALYKYPLAAFPYDDLRDENARRGFDDPEYELLDTGVFEGDRYVDLTVEYAKGGPNDILIRLTAANRGPDAAPLHLLPTLWFRNTWTWGCRHEGCTLKPRMSLTDDGRIDTWHESLGEFVFVYANGPDGNPPETLFTENETNTRRLYGEDNYTPYVKDAFEAAAIRGDREAVNPKRRGTKAAPWYRLELPPGGEAVVRLRLFHADEAPDDPLGEGFDALIETRRGEADAFYGAILSESTSEEARRVARQAWAGLLWSRQFYHYIVKDWLAGDPELPDPPPGRGRIRNGDWPHLFNRDVIPMPDTWEYPWYATWDLAFHAVAMADIDPDFAKGQLILFLREWYMHPNGQLPAYEWNLCDVNPPVHAWACWRVYKMTGERGERDREFLASAFQKLLVNFTWWVNRKDAEGRHLFSGGFLGMDNIGVFDRSEFLPKVGRLTQADGTAWMAFYCGAMLSMALELACEDRAYEDMASKFFEHFVHIVDAMNTLGGSGLWDERDGFYYDRLKVDGRVTPLSIRSMVGLVPLIAVEVLDDELFDRLPGFAKRTRWFVENRGDLARHIAYLERAGGAGARQARLLAVPSRERLERVLSVMLDEGEFLSPYGIRSLSKRYDEEPFVFDLDGLRETVRYVPGDADSGLFGGNSNWRGPVWFPVNYLIVEALQRYGLFYGDDLTVECPTGSGRRMTLTGVACEIARRLTHLFLPDDEGNRPCHGGLCRWAEDPHWRDLVLFHEFFNGDTGAGHGASHQTGWTALIAKLIEDEGHAHNG